MKLANPLPYSIPFELVRLGATRWLRETVVLFDYSSHFDAPTIITGRRLTERFRFDPGRDLFLALIDCPGGWSVVHVKFCGIAQSSPDPPDSMDIAPVKAQFIADLEEFAVRWTPRDTEELVLLLPRAVIHDATFDAADAVVRGSALCARFSTTVVLLRALILYLFNNVRPFAHRPGFPLHWEATPAFIAWEDAADVIMKAIVSSMVCASFSVDRHAAQQLSLAGRGDCNRCIVSQLTRVFGQLALPQLQCKLRPWKVAFAGELAIDAGGPARELMAEGAASIFDPASRLSVPTPNNRRKSGPHQDTFLPVDPTR
jgi:hypothetical protein